MPFPFPRDDDNGQMNIDFLFGLAIFLMAFLYVFTFIPGLFVPYQASAVDLSSVAYKTGAILAEDPGWYIYTEDGVEMGNPAWEGQSLSRLARIGLSVDKMSPNVISIQKVKALGDIHDYAFIRDKIGLAGTLTYNFSLSLTMNDTLANRRVELLNITPWYKGDSVERVERNVMVDMGKQLYLDCHTYDMPSGAIHVSLADMPSDDTQNVTIRIYNASGPGSITFVGWQEDPMDIPTPVLFGEGFAVRKNGVRLVNINLATFGPGDTIEVDIFRSAIQDETKYFWINSATSVFPTTEINYYKDPKYQRMDVCYPGVLNVEVWANAYI